MKKILIVFGTRPEAIKMCPLVNELRKDKNFNVVVCATGQHKEMLEQVLKVFEIIPEYNLNIMKEKQSLYDVTINVLLGMREVLRKEKPDIVLVHGDTTTTFAAAISAFYEGIKIAHVEAGLRTYNMTSPFPEEFNRECVSLLAAWHFAPTETAKKNLISEGKKTDTVFITGNTGIDALKTTINENYSHPVLEWAKGSRMVLLTAHRRENLGKPLYDIFTAVKRVLDEIKDIKIVYPIHLNPAIRQAASEIFGGHKRLRIMGPLDALDFHNFMNQAYLILTDSGGIQEEASALGKPTLVLRDTTERPEGIEAGSLKLVGTNRSMIERELKRVLTDRDYYNLMCDADNPYGDGTASRKIAEILRKQY